MAIEEWSDPTNGGTAYRFHQEKQSHRDIAMKQLIDFDRPAGGQFAPIPLILDDGMSKPQAAPVEHTPSIEEGM